MNWIVRKNQKWIKVVKIVIYNVTSINIKTLEKRLILETKYIDIKDKIVRLNKKLEHIIYYK